MADKNLYQGFLRATVKGAIHSARAAAGLEHPGMKGTVLEILVGGLFRPLLPSDIGVGTGQVMDSVGKLSPQVDVLLYDKSILPPVLFNGSFGIFPVEAVLYAIEVKTTLTKAEIQRAHENAKALHELHYLSASADHDGAASPVERCRSVIFALSTDLHGSGKSEVTRYKEVYGNDVPYIRALCVVGKEYWWDEGSTWLNFKCKDEFDEILAFLGGVANTYRKITQSRGFPPLGHYIIPERLAGVTLYPTHGPLTVKIGPDGFSVIPRSRIAHHRAKGE